MSTKNMLTIGATVWFTVPSGFVIRAHDKYTAGDLNNICRC